MPGPHTSDHNRPRGGPPRRAWLLVAALCLGLLTPFLTAPAAQAAPVTVLNGTQFTDPAGNPVHAHGGGIIKVGGYYYWFGENRQEGNNAFRYVSAYRSTDLRTWEFRNHVLTQASDPELQVANIERPKVMYNEATGQFVMWMHKENGQDYSEARAAVAVSDTVDGDYTWQGSFRPLGHMSRDITVFVDDDGTGYMASAARENYDLHIYRLTDDYTDVESLVANPWPGGHREAPALFKRNGVYFMLTSGATGWSPNQQRYATSTSLSSGWSSMQNVGDSTAYGSQTAWVLPIQGTSGTSYLYLGDRWGNSIGGLVNDSRYVWLPLTFPTDRSLSMSWAPELTIDTAAGTVRATGGPYETLTARHSGKCVDIPSQSHAIGQQAAQYTCNGGGNQRFWARDAGGGYVQLVTRHSSLCLAAAGGSTADGAAVMQAVCGNGPEQQWRLTDAGDGYVRVTARHSGKCLDVSDESTADSARLIQYACSGAAHQSFRRATV
ncbi:RICIN domain-containing protein [Streptomyces litchfieldiae]|uniref:RICIN domain-containing protein n=1 Tax=Streptomyces litchfieldiae TaxID=3075543 RepID=A0ABU2MZM8_9ACTN|nr:RICIN domain-containing protein [Streptomyces sp. DSM 44938]MDT0347107.1 RICIN domain-containing protein [Streptomyces sp. DSM 44938]